MVELNPGKIAAVCFSGLLRRVSDWEAFRVNSGGMLRGMIEEQRMVNFLGLKDWLPR